MPDARPFVPTVLTSLLLDRLSATASKTDGPAAAIPGAPALSDNSRPVFNWLFGAGLLWRGYTAVVGGIIIVAVWTTDLGSSAVYPGMGAFYNLR